jgi:hypothetical protein
MTSRPDLDPSRIPDEAWEFEGYSADGLRRHSIAWIDREAGTYFRKVENLAESAIVDRNQDERNEADGKRWSAGTGTEKGGNMPFVKVASIPLNVFYRDFAARLREGDTDFSKWWLNQGENSVYRTRRGKV